jgi:PIN domain nuclease of toxin-antitoxin system
LILLDTHIWIWWVQGDPRLSEAAIDFLDARSANSIAISSISFWEVAMLASRNRLILPDTVSAWLDSAAADPKVVSLDISPDVATAAALLPGHHKDPADRLLIAHALLGEHQLVTEDQKIHVYEEVKTIHAGELVDA